MVRSVPGMPNKYFGMIKAPERAPNTQRSAVAQTSPEISSEPKAPTPVVVILLEPVSIVPNPLVIDPEFKAPVVTIFEPPTLWLEKYVETVSTLVILIVPPSFIKIPSPDATAVVPLAVPPSIKFISSGVAEIAVVVAAAKTGIYPP